MAFFEKGATRAGEQAAIDPDLIRRLRDRVEAAEAENADLKKKILVLEMRLAGLPGPGAPSLFGR